MREIAEQTHAIGGGHQHDISAGEGLAVEPDVRSAAEQEGATVEPHHNRQCLVGRARRRPDIQREAILVDAAGSRTGPQLLRAVGAERRRLADSVPRFSRLGRSPAPRADRRRGEGNALVDADAVAGAREQAALGADDAKIRQRLQGGQVDYSAA